MGLFKSVTNNFGVMQTTLLTQAEFQDLIIFESPPINPFTRIRFDLLPYTAFPGYFIRIVERTPEGNNIVKKLISPVDPRGFRQNISGGDPNKTSLMSYIPTSFPLDWISFEYALPDDSSLVIQYKALGTGFPQVILIVLLEGYVNDPLQADIQGIV